MGPIIVLGIVIIILLLIIVPAKIKYRGRDYEVYSDFFPAANYLFIGEFIVSDISKGLLFRKGSNSYIKSKEDYLKLVGPREANELLEHHYYSKYSMAIIIIAVFCFIGTLSAVSSYQKVNADIEPFEQSTERPDYSEEEITKELVVTIEQDGQVYEEIIDVSIPDKIPTLDQKEAIVSRAFEKLKVEILAENESLKNVRTDLNLYKYDEDNEVNIKWDTSGVKFISKSGEINPSFLEEESTEFTLYATLSIDEYEMLHEIAIIIEKPNPLELKRIVEKDLEVALEEEGLSQGEEYHLPETIVSQNRELNVKWRTYVEEIDYTNALLITVFGCVLGVLFFKVIDERLKEKLGDKKNQMMIQFPVFADKFTLLYSCGISPVEAVKRYLVTSDQSKTNYFDAELRLMVEEIEIGGAGLDDAFLKFGKRSRVPDILKFTTLVVQDINRGDKNMSETIGKLVSEAWEERKKIVLEMGNKASTKLLLPMLIMLLMVMIIVMTPGINTFKSF